MTLTDIISHVPNAASPRTVETWFNVGLFVWNGLIVLNITLAQMASILKHFNQFCYMTVCRQWLIIWLILRLIELLQNKTIVLIIVVVNCFLFHVSLFYVILSFFKILLSHLQHICILLCIMWHIMIPNRHNDVDYYISVTDVKFAFFQIRTSFVKFKFYLNFV